MNTKIKITKGDISARQSRVMKITKDSLFQPVILTNVSDGETVFLSEIAIAAKGHPGNAYKLKYKMDEYLSTANNEGEFRFDQIKLGDGRNCFEIVNQEYGDVESQNIKFAVIYDRSKLIYIGRSDPVVGKIFTTEDDISIIIRCKRCGTFYYKSTISDGNGCCANCRHSQFWNHRDKEFHQQSDSIRT